MPKRNMSIMYHLKSQEPLEVGRNVTRLKFHAVNRNIPHRLIHYKGPHQKSIKGGYYPVSIWGFPAIVFGFPAYIYFECKYNGKGAEHWGYGEAH